MMILFNANRIRKLYIYYLFSKFIQIHVSLSNTLIWIGHGVKICFWVGSVCCYKRMSVFNRNQDNFAIQESNQRIGESD